MLGMQLKKVQIDMISLQEDKERLSQVNRNIFCPTCVICYWYLIFILQIYL